MQLTPLHRELDIMSTELNFEMIEHAVTKGIKETSDLDWKGCLPKKSGPDWQGEFAKDVAAMANSGGGMIVFGVSDKGSRAAKICSTGPFPESEDRDLRDVIFNQIHPPLYGVKFTELVNETTGDVVVSMLVPPSVDGPHLFRRKDHFSAPKRDGARTVFMSEWEISVAYRHRFDRKSQQDKQIDYFLDDTKARLVKSSSVWLVAVARPKIVATPKGLGREWGSDLISSALSIRERFVRANFVSPLMKLEITAPKRGLRKVVHDWVDSNPTSDIGDRVVSEIYSDGSVSLSMAIGGISQWSPEVAPYQVDSMAVENAIADFIGLVFVVGSSLRIHSTYDVLVSLSPMIGKNTEILALNPSWEEDELGTYVPITAFETVVTEMDHDSGDNDLLLVMKTLVGDIINQGGRETFGVLASRPKVSRTRNRVS